MACQVLTSGYVSMDHIVKIKSPARVGHTSLIDNSTCATVFYGGCHVNIAYALCRLGVSAMPILRVGPDWETNGFRAFLEGAGVPLDATTVVEGEATSVCYLIEDNEGQHVTLFYPGSMDARYHRPLDDRLFEGVRYGVVTVASRPDNEEFFRKCRLHGVPVVFGMKADDDAFPRPFLEELLLKSRVIFTNESERAGIERQFGLGSITELMERGEARVIVTTYGERGSQFWHMRDDGSVETACVPVCQCTEVVDTAGGGDAYMSGFLYGLVNDRPLEDCCRMGSTLSSFVLEHEGCCTGAPDLDTFMSRFEAFRAC
ncbi:carbohydrate kinase family protein [Thermophilibacter sp.]